MGHHLFTCRACGRKVSTPTSAIGQLAKCLCGEAVRVPTKAEEAAYQEQLKQRELAAQEASERAKDEARYSKERHRQQKEASRKAAREEEERRTREFVQEKMDERQKTEQERRKQHIQSDVELGRRLKNEEETEAVTAGKTMLRGIWGLASVVMAAGMFLIAIVTFSEALNYYNNAESAIHQASAAAMFSASGAFATCGAVFSVAFLLCILLPKSR